MNKLFTALPIISLLTLGYFLLNDTRDDSSLTSQSISLEEWDDCALKLAKIPNICFQFDSFFKTYIAFSKLTSALSEQASAECQEFFAYQNSVKQDQPLHYNNYYEKCYLSSQVKEIVKQSTCFYDTYYIPLYIGCAYL